MKNGPRRLFVPNSAFLTREFMVGMPLIATCDSEHVRNLYLGLLPPLGFSHSSDKVSETTDHQAAPVPPHCCSCAVRWTCDEQAVMCSGA